MQIEKNKVRRILYTFCFLFISVVDWINSTQDGRLQFVATNLIGLWIGIIILGHYKLKDFKKNVYFVWLGIILVGTPIALIWGHQNYPYFGKFVTAVINVIVYSLIAIKTLEGGIAKKKVPKVIWPAWGIFILMMFIMLLSPNKILWPFWFAVMFGVLYLTDLGREETELIITSLTDGVLLSFLFIQGFAFLFRPYDVPRYVGNYINTNNNALYYLMVYCALLCKNMLLKDREKVRALRIITIVAAGALIGLITYTGCRTALVAAVPVTIVYVICYIWNEEKRIAKLFIRIGIIALSAIISAPLLYFPIRFLPTVRHRPFFWMNEYSEDKVHSFDSWNSEKYVSFEEMLAEDYGRILSFVPSVKERYYELNANSSDGETLDPEKMNNPEECMIQSTEKLSTIEQRAYIYKYYIGQLRMKGHSFDEDGFFLSPRYYESHAHNFLLQMAFWFGIPVGIGFLFLFILCIVAFVRLLHENNSKQACVFGCFIAGFIAFSMFEYAWGVGSLSFVLFFFLLYFSMRSKDISQEGKEAIEIDGNDN